jgi:GNAT superfamily N-acetyltransferase
VATPPAHHTPLPLTFRPAAASDVDAVVALVESAYRGESSKEGWTTEADLLEGQRTDAAAVAEAVDRPDGVVLLALATDTLVGCCQLVAETAGRARFGMFAVAPNLQGRSVGSALLAEAERLAGTRWGTASLAMEVIGLRTELLAWYARRGYRATGETTPFPYGDPRFGLPRRDDLEFVVLSKRLVE